MSPSASIAIPSGWRSRGSLNIPSKKTSALSRGSMGSKVLPRLRAWGTTGLSGGDLWRYGLVWISEALLGHQGVTARVSGVPVVRISSKLFVELCVFVQLVPVQADTQPRAIGDLDRPTLVLEPASVYDVVLQMVVVRIGREGEVGEHGPEVQHGSELYPQFPDECTAAPSWKVSHTPAALTHGRIPPQKVVSSRMTSAAGFSTLVASCSKSITTVLVERGIFTFSRRRRIPLSPQVGSS